MSIFWCFVREGLDKNHKFAFFVSVCARALGSKRVRRSHADRQTVSSRCLLTPHRIAVSCSFENTLRYMVPAFVEVLGLYEEQVMGFGIFVKVCVCARTRSCVRVICQSCVFWCVNMRARAHTRTLCPGVCVYVRALSTCACACASSRCV